jgi:DNA repair exonuclease SbcCD ATPase subunit
MAIDDQGNNTDYKKDSSDRHRKAVGEINQLKSELKGIDPLNASNIKNRLECLRTEYSDLSSQIIALIDSIIEQTMKLEKEGKDAAAMRESINQNILKTEEAVKQEEAKRAQHETRLAETDQLQSKYDKIEKEFTSLRDADTDISKKINSGQKLTDDEKAKFTRIPRDEDEKKKFEKEDAIKAEGWGLHYKLKNNHEKIAEYSKEKVETHKENLANNKYVTPKQADEAKVENLSHEANLKKSLDALEKLKANDKARENERATLSKALKEFGADACKHKIMEHQKYHGEHYANSPEHSGAKEFNALLESFKSKLKLEVDQGVKMNISPASEPGMQYSPEIQAQVSKMKQVFNNPTDSARKSGSTTPTREQIVDKNRDVKGAKVDSSKVNTNGAKEMTQADRLKNKAARIIAKKAGGHSI